MPTSPPSITTLPAAPDPSNRATFNALAYPWSAALPTFGTEISAVATNVKANADEAQADAVATAADRVQTGLDVVAAAASAASAIAAPGVQATSTSSVLVGLGSKSLTIQTGKAYSVGQSVVIADTSAPSTNWMFGQITSYNSGTGALVVMVVQTFGSGTIAAWTISISASPAADSSVAMLRRAITGADTALLSDAGGFIDVTSGTFTLAFSAIGTLGNGWYCYIRNSGTGDVTLDPNASETIDGLTNFVMYPGEVRLVQCDGSALRSIVLASFARTFTSSGTFTKPPGYQKFGALVWSGGASGAKNTEANGSYGAGAGGGCFPFTLDASSFGASETITVGAGGASVTANTTIGNVGGNSSIGALAVVYAGSNPINGGTALLYSGSTATVISGGAPNYEGGRGETAPRASVYGGSSGSNNASVDTPGSLYGGAGGGTHNGTILKAAGTSVYGGNGGAASLIGNATAGTAPGGGGGMGLNSVGDSGAGARGEVRIWGVL
jgi:hypothetical protein